MVTMAKGNMAEVRNPDGIQSTTEKPSNGDVTSMYNFVGNTDLPITESISDINIIHTGTLSEEQFNTITYITNRCLFPVVGFLGLITNVLNYAVFSHSGMKMHRSQITYLKALSVVDFIYLFLYLYANFFLEIFLHQYPTLISKIATYSSAYITRPITNSAGAISILLNVIISFERFLAICFPMSIKSSIVDTRPYIPISLAVLFQTVVTLIAFFTYKISSYFDPIHKVIMWRTVPSEFFANNYRFVLAFGTIVELFYHGITEILVFIFSVSTIVQLRIASLRRLHMTQGQYENSSSSESQVTHMLLCISFLFIACTIPSVFITMLFNFNTDFNFFGKEHFLISSMYKISVLLTKTNSSVNIFVYIATSKNFRNTLKAVLRLRRKEQNQFQSSSHLSQRPAGQSADTN